MMTSLKDTAKPNVRLPVDLWPLVVKAARARKSTVQDFVTLALVQGLRDIAKFQPLVQRPGKYAQRSLGRLPNEVWAKVVYTVVLHNTHIQDFVIQALENATKETPHA